MEKSKTSFPPVSFEEFSVPSYEEWKAAAELTLKGADFDKKLLSKTFEGITLKPIYNQQDVEATAALPGQPGYRRGATAAGYLGKDCQGLSPVLADTPKEANTALLAELKDGANGINLRLSPATKGCGCQSGEGLHLLCVPDVTTLFAGVDLAKVRLHISCGPSALPVLGLLLAAKVGAEAATGTVGAAPLAVLAHHGKLPRPSTALYDEMAEAVTLAKAAAPGLRCVLATGQPYASGGADSATELALLLAEASEYLAALTQREVPIDDAATSITLSPTLGANYFMEIAKLRATRMLYSHLVAAFGGSEEAGRAHISALTSPFTKTVYDPYVNVLRCATEAFSGMVGGAEELTVTPFDEPLGRSDDHAMRMARNIPILLKEEFELRAPIDPAGGSWYVETLTNQLVEAVWAKFTAIEAEGGLLQALLAGTAQQAVAAGWANKTKQLNTRALRAVGTNMYANATEKKLTRPSRENKTSLPAAGTLALAATAVAVQEAFAKGENILSVNMALGQTGGESGPAIPVLRLTQEFEALRDSTAQKGGAKVFLANMGPVGQHKARADFAVGFFEVGGFAVESPTGFNSIEAAAEAAVASGAAACVICSTDDTYPELVPPLATLLKKQAPSMRVLVAGAPAPEHKQSYLDAGVWDFIHIRANCLQLLQSIQVEGGKQHG